jgi:hypothetical protein
MGGQMGGGTRSGGVGNDEGAQLPKYIGRQAAKSKFGGWFPKQNKRLNLFLLLELS